MIDQHDHHPHTYDTEDCHGLDQAYLAVKGVGNKRPGSRDGKKAADHFKAGPARNTGQNKHQSATSGYDMAPVRDGITDQNEQNLSRAPGVIEGSPAPLLPVHRISGMLPQVGGKGPVEIVCVKIDVFHRGLLSLHIMPSVP